MTLRASARRRAGNFPARLSKRESGIVLDASANEYEYRCVWPCAASVEISRKAIPHHLLGQRSYCVPCAGLRLDGLYQCVRRQHLSVREQRGVSRRRSSGARRARSRARPPATIINDVFADCPDAASAIERPVSVAATTSIMFNERFAAFAAQSEAPARVAEATQIAEVAAAARSCQSSPSRRRRSRPLPHPCRSRSRRPTPARRRIQAGARPALPSATWRSAPRRR